VPATCGPLHVSSVERDDPLLEDVITAGSELGWRRMRDLNETDEERIGYAMATIRDGQRVSAATAFLHPIVDRPNLTVALDTVIDEVLLDGDRAVGVRGRRDGQGVEARAAREVILATGTIATPRILQLSGIGPAETLRSAGVDVVVDSPNVGARMREHRVFLMQFRLVEDLGYNRLLGVPGDPERPPGGAAVRHRRVLQDPSGTRPPGRPVPDLAVLDAAAGARQGGATGARAGDVVRRLALRPDSAGSIRVTSADPDVPLDIDTNYLATEHDRTTAAGVFRGMRRLFATAPLANRIKHETVPGQSVQTDEEIIDAALATGTPGYHAIGTCAMGPNDDDVVDSALRVRGVTNLRVVDASVLPIMVSGNLNGPISALAWRAADLILQGA
jgi:choline dehydrogenase